MALIAGEVQMGYNNVQTSLQNAATAVRALAIGEPQRLPHLPDIPTVAETLPGFEMSPWVGLFVPAKTPKEIVARLSKEVASNPERIPPW